MVIVFLAAHFGGSSVKQGTEVRTATADPAVSLSPERSNPPSSAVSPPSTVPLTSTPTSATVQPPTVTTPSPPPAITLPTPPTTEPLNAPTCPSQGLFPGGTSLPNSGPIVPSGAQAAIVCEYSWNVVALHVTSTLVQSSSTLTGLPLASLVDAVDVSGPEYGSAPSPTPTTTIPIGTGAGSAIADPAPEYELFFSYPEGDVVAFGVTPNGPLSQLASSPSDTEGALWVPSPILVAEVSSFFN
jgi:hypothetical protein